MAKNVFDTLEERGYFSQATHRDEIYDLLSKPGVSFYIGFDPTADSHAEGRPQTDRSHGRRHGHDRRPFRPYRYASDDDR